MCPMSLKLVWSVELYGVGSYFIFVDVDIYACAAYDLV